MSSILKDIKILLRISGDDENVLLKALVTQALEWISVECNMGSLDVEDLSSGVKSLLIDMVIFRYGVLGKEGIASENIVELSYSYREDYPLYIVRRMKRLRVMGVR